MTRAGGSGPGSGSGGTAGAQGTTGRRPGSLPGPTGAADAGPGSPGKTRRRAEVVHRGVRWRRSVGGTISWLNDGLGQWVTWYPGSDAPPMPPGWSTEASSAPDVGEGPELVDRAPGLPAGPVQRRPAVRNGARGRQSRPTDDSAVERPTMRSPYRLAPVFIAVAIVAVAAYQATRPVVKASAQQIAAAEALRGQCLARSGGTSNQPKYSAVPVACSASSASVRVVAVVVPKSKAGPHACPSGAGVVQVLQPGIEGEPVECTEPVKRR